MAHCAATTKSGAPCRREALPGRDFCAVHVRFPPPVALPPVGVPPEETEMTMRPKKIRVRYTGTGTYWIRGYEFSVHQREHEVPFELAEYLIEEVPELFEAAS